MALTNCPECKKQISDQAKTCPDCGFPIKIQTTEFKHPSTAFRMIKWVFIALFLVFLFKACTSTPTSKQNTPAATTDNIQYEIAKAFADEKMSGCGEFTWTANPGQNHEYTVRCSSDGLNWTTYTVWTKTGRIVSGTVP